MLAAQEWADYYEQLKRIEARRQNQAIQTHIAGTLSKLNGE
jgi:hypothetical protein